MQALTHMARRDAQIVADYRSGQVAHVIAARYGLTYQRIYQILQEHGVTARDGGRTVQIQARKRLLEAIA